MRTVVLSQTQKATAVYTAQAASDREDGVSRRNSEAASFLVSQRHEIKELKTPQDGKTVHVHGLAKLEL